MITTIDAGKTLEKIHLLQLKKKLNKFDMERVHQHDKDHM